jgi:two-component system, sensor histidine kinase and response regulator
LVDNACRFSVKGTAIGIRLQHDHTLSVRDSGRGMTNEQIGQIGAFHQFERKKHEQQGLGLGLALVKKLAARHGADFSIESTATNGSMVTVAFPPPPASPQ